MMLKEYIYYFKGQYFMKKEKKHKISISQIIIPIITMIFGMFLSDITYSCREDLKKGNISFISNNTNQKIDVIFVNNTGDETIIRAIENNKYYKLYPGSYEYNLYIGQYLLGKGNVDIKQSKKSMININQIPNNIFQFKMSVDKDIYGPGDQVLLTLYSYSTSKTWIYLYHYSKEKFIELNINAIEMEPFDTKMITNITANKFPGEDNIVGFALTEDNNQILDNALSNFLNKKSEYKDENQKWKSDWISFKVK
jgi:hypothetical protein